MRVVISEKFVEIFGWYENDLDMVQQLYEKHKVCFYMFDNMCPLNVLHIKPDTPINVYTRFCLNTAKSKFSLVSPVAD